MGIPLHASAVKGALSRENIVTTSTNSNSSSASASTSASTAVIEQPIIRRIDDRFISIQIGSRTEVRFSPIRPGISFLTVESLKPVAKSAPSSAGSVSKSGTATPSTPSSVPANSTADLSGSASKLPEPKREDSPKPSSTAVTPAPAKPAVDITVSTSKPLEPKSADNTKPSSTAVTPAAKPAVDITVSTIKPLEPKSADNTKPSSTAVTPAPAKPAVDITVSSSKPLEPKSADATKPSSTAATPAPAKPAVDITVSTSKPLEPKSADSTKPATATAATTPVPAKHDSPLPASAATGKADAATASSGPRPLSSEALIVRGTQVDGRGRATPESANAALIRKLHFLDGADRPLTEAQLIALDKNKDSRLDNDELAGLHAWTDRNEDGLAQAGELTSLPAAMTAAGLSGGLHVADYQIYLRGTASYHAPEEEQALPSAEEIARQQSNGGDGNDVVIGKSDGRFIIGGWGNDRIWGGDGDDRIVGSQLGGGVMPLPKGKTDDDVIYGRAGNDIIWSGAGNDLLWGGEGGDGLRGGEGNDTLFGGSGDDGLAGDEGDDVLFGGDGDDGLVGGPGYPLAGGVSDNNMLYGGAGNDRLNGSAGNDLLDGGTGDDRMCGWDGDDTYVVDSEKDEVIEVADGGHDTVLAGLSYTLTNHVEDLRLLEGGSYNGTGNGSDNRIVGNSQDNILDGLGGADTMIGGQGNDRYFVDNVGDRVIEEAGEGIDTVYSSVSMTLGANVENLTLTDARTPIHGELYGQDVVVYGNPRSYVLDYYQGDEVPGFTGTCGDTAVANVLRMAGQWVTEKEAVERAIENHWCVTDPKLPPSKRGGLGTHGMVEMMQSYGVRAASSTGYHEAELVQWIKEGKGVVIIVDADALWGVGTGRNSYYGPHAVAVTGVACSAQTGEVQGFYIADSGRYSYSDMCRFLPISDLRRIADLGFSSVHTLDSVKLLNRNINATGNELDNTLVGNLDDNIITGGKGNDTLAGQAGNDTYVFGKGDGRDLVVDHDATAGNIDTIKFTDARQTNLWFRQVGKDLQIDVLGTTDQVTVKDWYVGGDSGTDNRIERIKTADGKTLYDSDVDKLVQAMASFDPPAATQTSWTEGQTSKGKVLLTVTH
ncbi:C39 family peptidase [Herbaspirillum seropedicae]|uniref:C39 family peptidase n=1 Tax=Herbaspirillum seropedicae TaxID=964 RepID=UPI003FCE6323